MKKRKIMYISGTRADYGLMRSTLLCIKKHPKLDLEIVATGMHLIPEFGMTINEIRKDEFKIHKIESVYEKDEQASMVNFIGSFIKLLNEKMKKIKPDIIMLLGDRAEMLAGAIVGVYLSIPVAHIHGGDVSFTVDEIVRHSITKLSSIHFAATQRAKERIIKMGEDSRRVFLVGAPGLDSILNEKLFSEREIVEKYKLDSTEPLLLVIQHPVIGDSVDVKMQMRETMEAIREMSCQTIILYPNADAGGREMIKTISMYRSYTFMQIYESLPRKDYLSLMKFSSVMVGNSSSGIIEASLYNLPVVNIGPRQKGRERAINVVDSGYDREQIKSAIKKGIFDRNFRRKIKKCKNPYGDGKAGVRIANILGRLEMDRKLFQKQITY
jgi:UDP-hydrolysing UDP-N-acetyl-D-glucosamine 2-epimerase